MGRNIQLFLKSIYNVCSHTSLGYEAQNNHGDVELLLILR